MKLTNDFEVPVGVDRVWEVLLDVERVAPCLPGATIDSHEGDTYKGQMKIKLGPITSTYKGTVKIEEADEAGRRAVMKASAKDARGQGTAAATITSTMEPAGEGTKVSVETDMRVTGPAAQFGRGVMQDVSAKLMNQFAECLAKRITGDPEAEANGTPQAAATAEAAPGGGAEEAAAPATAGQAPAAPSAPPSTEAPSRAAPSNGGTAGAPSSERGTPDVLDLGDASRDAVLKRVVPAIGGILLALVLLRVLRGRR